MPPVRTAQTLNYCFYWITQQLQHLTSTQKIGMFFCISFNRFSYLCICLLNLLSLLTTIIILLHYLFQYLNSTNETFLFDRFLITCDSVCFHLYYLHLKILYTCVNVICIKLLLTYLLTYLLLYILLNAYSWKEMLTLPTRVWSFTIIKLWSDNRISQHYIQLYTRVPNFCSVSFCILVFIQMKQKQA